MRAALRHPLTRAADEVTARHDNSNMPQWFRSAFRLRPLPSKDWTKVLKIHDRLSEVQREPHQ